MSEGGRVKRVSDIVNTEEFRIERQRESLRDRRWKRHRSKIYTVLTCIAVVGVLFFNGDDKLIRLIPVL